MLCNKKYTINQRRTDVVLKIIRIQETLNKLIDILIFYHCQVGLALALNKWLQYNCILKQRFAIIGCDTHFKDDREADYTKQYKECQEDSHDKVLLAVTMLYYFRWQRILDSGSRSSLCVHYVHQTVSFLPTN